VVACFAENDASVLYRIDREYTGTRLQLCEGLNMSRVVTGSVTVHLRSENKREGGRNKRQEEWGRVLWDCTRTDVGLAVTEGNPMTDDDNVENDLG